MKNACGRTVTKCKSETAATTERPTFPRGVFSRCYVYRYFVACRQIRLYCFPRSPPPIFFFFFQSITNYYYYYYCCVILVSIHLITVLLLLLCGLRFLRIAVRAMAANNGQITEVIIRHDNEVHLTYPIINYFIGTMYNVHEQNTKEGMRR